MVQRSLTASAAAAAVMALLTLTACGSSGNQAGSGTTTAGASTASSSANAQAHNDQDVMFAQHMIAHHQQAIQMSDVILGKQGIDPRVIELANQIKSAQGPEIQQMQTWLNQWGQPTTPGAMTPSSTMPGMPSHSGMPGMPGMPSHSGMPGMPGMGGMDGMMSEQDMQALQNAQGVDASKLFLTQMIQHHQGAITMAQNEVKSGQYSPATAMAQSIVTSQQKEITTMQTILGSL
ncbi:DUF305 domain-containing protein [Mycobacterium kansasii]|uniref:DUF305 domain-containing protein n=1 Tax=Mycobacterium innocens TaxID=2341083 RepID=A0A498Q7Z8_9MYCO|nr:DUF305 domain-containing protein [Mycobacterium innocens]KZS57328.1 DUF305 domain-containing protein [Mycobacterium kansasii]VBA40853.1 hypothetical protein LAUMK13_03273 [Mycobacterium innocens]